MIERLNSKLNRAKTLAERAIRIYINPPAESKVFVSPEKVREIAMEVAMTQTAAQPKQVVSVGNESYVSCMKGRCLQIFSTNQSLKKIDEIKFDDQCVEVTEWKRYLFTTTSNFSRDPSNLFNKLWIIDSESHNIVSSVDTEGNWSKVIAIHPSGNYAFVSNWHSHNISIISLKDIKNPKVIQVLAPEEGRKQLESPRGIAFTSTGEIGLVTGFYSRNLLELQKDPTGDNFHFSFISDKLTVGEYGGNPRDIVIPKGNNIALYSNLGTNTVHSWSIPERKILKTTKVGKEPNSISLYGENDELLLVSCRASKSVYILDTETLDIIGRSQITGSTPTGLCSTRSGFLVTDFESNDLRAYQFKND